LLLKNTQEELFAFVEAEQSKFRITRALLTKTVAQPE